MQGLGRRDRVRIGLPHFVLERTLIDDLCLGFSLGLIDLRTECDVSLRFGAIGVAVGGGFETIDGFDREYGL